MKSTWILIVGIAVGSFGIGVFITDTKNNSRNGSPNSAASDPASQQERQSKRRLFGSQWSPSSGNGSRPVDVRGESRVPNTDASPGTSAPPKTQPLVTNSPRPSGKIDAPTREQLAANAAAVQRRASGELERLTRLLDLSEEQQDRIFPLLARSSSAYHPALAIQVGNSETSDPSNRSATGDRGTNATSNGLAKATSADSAASEPLMAKEANEGIHAILTPEQQQALEDELIDEDLWWSDIIADLEDELDESTQIATGDPETEVVPEDVEYRGNTGIGALLQQADEESSKKNVTEDTPATSNTRETNNRGSSR